MSRYEVILLEDAVTFLASLPVKLRAKAYRGIELLEDFGTRLPMPHAKALKGTGGLGELRVKWASDIVRLFYFQHANQIFVVTSGFVKKTDRTDPRELDRAINLMNAFKEQKP